LGGVGVGVADGLGVAVRIGVGIGVAVGRIVAFGALVGISVGAGVAVRIGVAVGSGVHVGSGVGLGVLVNTGVAVGTGVRMFGVLDGMGVEVGFAANHPAGSDQGPSPNWFAPRILNKRPDLVWKSVNKSTPVTDHFVDRKSYQYRPLLSDLCIT
jgi:hypothetical protein